MAQVWRQLALVNTQLEELEAGREALVPDRQTATGRLVPEVPFAPSGARLRATAGTVRHLPARYRVRSLAM